MEGRPMGRIMHRAWWLLAVATLVVGAYWGGQLLRAQGWAGATAWAQEEAGVTVSARAERVGQGEEERGTVYLNDRSLFTVMTTAGGLTGYERAMIVAKRVNDALAAGAMPEDFTAGVSQGLNVVLWKDRALITVDDAHAQALGKPRPEVAEEWAASLRTGLRQALGLPEPAPTEPAAATEGEEAAPTEDAEWQPSEPYTEKDVVIVSLGEGKQLGMARVKGPKSRVEMVQAVAAFETHYEKTLEIELYVPVSTKIPGENLQRIQGVGVVGLAKYRF